MRALQQVGCDHIEIDLTKAEGREAVSISAPICRTQAPRRRTRSERSTAIQPCFSCASASVVCCCKASAKCLFHSQPSLSQRASTNHSCSSSMLSSVLPSPMFVARIGQCRNLKMEVAFPAQTKQVGLSCLSERTVRREDHARLCPAKRSSQSKGSGCRT